MDDQLLQAATESFSLPHDVVTLPSNGKFYKSKKKSVKIGFLTATDENLLLNSVRGNSDNVVLTLVRNKLYEHDLRPEDMIEGDIQTILLYLRNTSFGPEYNLVLKDPQTGKPFDHVEILDEIDFKKTEVQPDENGIFTTTLPKCGSTVKLRLLTYGETVELDRLAETYPQGRIVPTITWKLNKQIVSVDGNEDKMMISKFIESMPIMDSKYIREFLNKNQPSLDLTRTTIAPSGERVVFNITFGVEFFRPFF
jgi:hypothetical protein